MVLKLEHINYGFSKEKLLLNDLSIELEQGKIYALMGANGAGKTTLFNIITGFIKPSSGNIILNDENVNNLLPFKRNRKGISRTFQDLRLISKLTVKENILLAMQNNPTDNWVKALLPKGVYSKKKYYLKYKADELISSYFLHDVQSSLAGEISYGQQKLLNIACCVSNNASLLLLDEPVAGINPAFRDKIVMILKQIRENGTTILMIEHNTEFINEIADEIFFLSSGKVTLYKNLETMKSDSTVLNAYM